MMRALVRCTALLALTACTAYDVPMLRPDPGAIQLVQIREGVWVHTSHYTYPNGNTYPSNGLVVQEGDGLLLIDTAWGEVQTAALLQKIAAEIGLPVKRAVITHAHGDRLLGVDLLRARGVVVFAHTKTVQLANESGLPLPSHTLAELIEPGEALDGGSVELFYPGPGHTPDNLMVWVYDKGVLFGGCAVREPTATGLGNVAQADLKLWALAIERALRRYDDAEIVVPGHGPWGTTELLHHTLKLLRPDLGPAV